MHVSCGPLTLTFENGFIRHVRCGDDEILRMVYFALRDSDWETLPLRITDLTITGNNQKFAARYQATNFEDGEDILKWAADITVSEDGKIVFRIDGVVLKTFRRNRSGFCVLHPIKECIDKPVIILHPEGSKTYSAFPRTVSPHNPFTNIRSMVWEGSQGKFELTFDGDVFETEDQRNWTDASFKTFCTPLSLPRPVTLNPGEQISQVVVFRPLTKLAPRSIKSEIQLTRGTAVKRLPKIGLGYSAEFEINAFVSERIRELRPDYLRCEIDLTTDNWQTNLPDYIKRLQGLQLPLELVVLSNKPEVVSIRSMVNLIMQAQIPINSLTLLSPTQLTTLPEMIASVPELKQLFAGLAIGAGTNFNFTEINRNQFNKGHLDFISFSIDPQEHAVDDTTIIENLEAQKYAVESAKNIYNLPVKISPLTLKRRHNPYTDNLNNRIIPLEKQFDARLQQPFGSVFTLGSIKHLCEAGVDSVSCHQLMGDLGVMDSSGQTHPVFSALKEISHVQKSTAFETISSHPLIADGIFFNDAVLVWNYTSSPIGMHIKDIAQTLGPYEFRTISL